MRLRDILSYAHAANIATIRQLMIISLFRNSSELGFQIIAKETRLRHPAVSRAVDALCIEGLLTRLPRSAGDDHRRTTVALTERGQEFVRGLEAA